MTFDSSCVGQEQIQKTTNSSIVTSQVHNSTEFIKQTWKQRHIVLASVLKLTGTWGDTIVQGICVHTEG
jgi:hypothetical protein